MDKFYYTIAQLPALTFDKRPVLSSQAFLEEAEKWLSSRELKALKSVDIRRLESGGSDHRLFARYQAFENELRSALAQWRRGRKNGQDIKPFGLPMELVKDGNPLEIEKKLLKYRWDFLDAQEENHHFDFGFILLYAMKLQVLDWLAEFDQTRGLNAFQELATVAYETEETAA